MIPTSLETREAFRQGADNLLRYGVDQSICEAFLQCGTREEIGHKVAQRHRSVVDAVADDRRCGNVINALIELQLLLAAAGLTFDGSLTVHAFDVFQFYFERVASSVQILQMLCRTKTPKTDKVTSFI